MIALSLLAAAFAKPPAAPACTPATPSDLEDVVQQGQAAIQADDVTQWSGAADKLEAMVPCLEAPISQSAWSEFLVASATVAFAEDADWQRPLTTALRLRPTIELHVSAVHPFAQWHPPTVPATEPLPRGVDLFVDGARAVSTPPTDGWHLVQRRSEEGFRGLLLRGEPIPPDWLEKSDLDAKARRRRAAHTWGTLLAATVGAAGGASFAISADRRHRFYDTHTAPSDYEALRTSANRSQVAGIALCAGAGVGLVLAWGVPW